MSTELKALSVWLRDQAAKHKVSICSTDMRVRDHVADLERWANAVDLMPCPPAGDTALQAWNEHEQSALNDWFLALPEGRRKVLIGDKWMLAGAAYLAGKAAAASPSTAPVGTLCVSHFRGNPAMENVEYQPLQDLPPGTYSLFAAPAAPARQPTAEEDAVLRGAAMRSAKIVGRGVAAPVAEPTDDQIDRLVLMLDEFGREYDQYEFGLPTSDSGARAEMRKDVREWFARESLLPTPEVAPK